MVNFFSKKKYLIDLLEGFIDIHNHILPGIDDGAQTVDDSIALLKGFSEFGVSDFIATPHIMHNYHDNSPSTIKDSLQILKAELHKNGLGAINIQASAEHMIDDNFETILEKKEVMPLAHEHLLVEMSYLQRPINFDKSIIAITSNRFFPVLAHPERYNFLHGRTRKYNEFKQQGILFQLNMLSLGEFYGKEVQKMAFRLVEEGMIDFIGSDIHNMNQLNSLKKLTTNKKMIKLLSPIIENTTTHFK
ncbi:histidinol phosphatase [Maribacter algarum]|uniref:protein-tyrosine-phosphatase n=1 Tax=Maribacter algarum (ex Zhang et al. 2020) TaxID=2578118 RepID=A0A5S3PHU8_9FLAO|nr:CpsB/CapC family capsule biosynthesis tyrosine phosphatase [Maribacter algarum]TMM53772.1 histidinol phosphatase [Maribacter algarum]